MRLINTSTRAFEEFIGRNIPQYAILSHTWEDGEVSFQDYVKGDHFAKKGYGKIDMTCKLAASQRIGYAWVDTCCIDKSSSAELTESINSMFRWYQRAVICYVFLSDLETTEPLESGLPSCRWFTRGWTLQELIAPRIICFYDASWTFRGEKTDLIPQLSAITRIRPEVLRHEERLSTICVAQKMSWAAYRQTTRVEDVAYCLLGIFDVNMPLIYGEEEKAFRRLQEEIIRTTPDLSILGWKWPPESPALFSNQQSTYSSVLATSPDVFAHATHSVAYPNDLLHLTDFSSTSQGLQICCHLAHVFSCNLPDFSSLIPISLSSVDGRREAIQLQTIGVGVYVRRNPYYLDWPHEAPTTKGTVRNRWLVTNSERINLAGAQRLHAQVLFSVENKLEMFEALPWARWNPEQSAFFSPLGSAQSSVAARIRMQDKELGRLDYTVDFVVYAVDWQVDANRPPGYPIPVPRYTILDWNEHRAVINELNTRITEYDPYPADSYLRHAGTPEVSKLVLKPSKGPPGRRAVISVRPELTTDPEHPEDPFWRLHVSCEECDVAHAPEPIDRRWAGC
ncbi:HET-domain-containing protein [Echria macrotheca]|uniref:HET-domain-containing protein n=1 Tax=Echria macrotheca TaxID=438768 RepID=A0AAJ0FER3_9PEZI|nr:HET-domain-containing protein [Echria macrotheca]